MTTLTIPGSGLSYADLCDTGPASEERKMWRALGDLAEILGVSQAAPGYGCRTKTVDEFLADLADVAPDGLDIVAAARAAYNQNHSDYPGFVERFEIRRLVPDGTNPGQMKFLTEETLPTYEAAVATMAEYRAGLGEDAILSIVSVRVTTAIDTYPKGYMPRE